MGGMPIQTPAEATGDVSSGLFTVGYDQLTITVP